MALTLGIDTATDVCTVALVEGDTTLFEAAIAVPRAHGARLAPLIGQAFEHTGRDMDDLGLVAVSVGPGSYTGLRIGMSTAKGLCLSTGAAIVAVPTLLALAGGALGTVAVVLPSRRGEVYASVVADGAEAEPAGAFAVADADAWLPDALDAIGGPGAPRLDGVRPEVPRLDLSTSGASVARLGRAAAEDRGPDDAASLEPVYLKPVAASQPRGIF